MENQKKQQEERAERERILRLIEENKRMELQQMQKRKENNLRYQQGNNPVNANQSSPIPVVGTAQWIISRKKIFSTYAKFEFVPVQLHEAVCRFHRFLFPWLLSVGLDYYIDVFVKALTHYTQRCPCENCCPYIKLLKKLLQL